MSHSFIPSRMHQPSHLRARATGLVLPLFLLSLAGFVLAGCAGASMPGGDDAAARSEAQLRARGAADSLTGALLGRLTAVMKQEGPAGAVDVCAREALPLTAGVAATRGVGMRRVTMQTRNAANAPDAWEAQVLATFEAQHRAGTLTPATEVIEAVETDRGPAFRYMRPLLVRDPCLRCHGDAAAIDPAVKARIAAQYPADKATGYRSGDLRGAISVTVPQAR